jgi:hypothetical protein
MDADDAYLLAQEIIGAQDDFVLFCHFLPQKAGAAAAEAILAVGEAAGRVLDAWAEEGMDVAATIDEIVMAEALRTIRRLVLSLDGEREDRRRWADAQADRQG